MSTLDYSRLPVYDSAEIVVCGGGVAGVFAAIAAANEGRDVLLIEQFGMLGGSATAGLVTPVMHTHIADDPPCSYLSNQVRERLLAMNACDQTGRSFDSLSLSIVLEDMCQDAHVRLLYHTFVPDVLMDGDKVDAVVIANKAGLSLVKAQIFIDCTGDGDVCVRAGADYTKGNPETGVNQPMSLRYVVDGVNFLELREFFEAQKKETGISRNADVSEDGKTMYADCCDNGNTFTLTSVFEKAKAAGDLTPEDHYYWQCFGLTGRPGSIAFNCPEFFEHIDGTNPFDLTQAQLVGKKAIMRQLRFYKKYFKGFENAFVSDIAVMVGVRESREIITDYVLTAADLYCKRKFDDMFCQSNYPIDVHGKVLSNQYLGEVSDDGKPWYEIPFRCLLVKGKDNLLVAGRCIGAEFLAEASIRIQQSARASGEAAGIAAAMALTQHVSPHAINGADVRAHMVEKGARFTAL